MGCARYSKEEVCAQILESQTLETPQSVAFEEGDWLDPQWWHLFNDEQLTHLIERALVQNPDALSAKARVDRLFAEAGVEKSPLYPQLSFQAFDNYQHLSKDSLDRFPPSLVPAVINQVDLTLNFQWEIDFFGRIRHTYQAALNEAFAAIADQALTDLMITTLLTATYFDLKWGLIQQKMTRALIDIRQNYASLIELRVKSGLSDEIDLAESLIPLNDYKRQMARVKEGIALSTYQLRTLAGVGPEGDLPISRPEAAFNEPFPIPSDLSSGLISRRPDIQAKIWAMESAYESVQAAEAAFYPTVNLLALGGLETLSWNKLFSADSFKGALNPILNLPIFTGGRLRSSLSAKAATFEEALFEYNQMILQSAKEVASSLTTVSSLVDRETIQAQNVQDSLKEFELRSLREESGIDSRLELLLSAENAILEQLTYFELNYMRQEALVTLIKALGGGYGSTCEQQ